MFIMTSLIITYAASNVSNGDEMEYKLMRDLFRNYDRRIRPSKNASDPLNVTFGLSLAQIIDVVSSFVHNHNSSSTSLLARIPHLSPVRN